MNLQVMMTVFSPSQALCSAITWAWVQISWGAMEVKPGVKKA